MRASAPIRSTPPELVLSGRLGVTCETRATMRERHWSGQWRSRRAAAVWRVCGRRGGCDYAVRDHEPLGDLGVPRGRAARSRACVRCGRAVPRPRDRRRARVLGSVRRAVRASAAASRARSFRPSSCSASGGLGAEDLRASSSHRHRAAAAVRPWRSRRRVRRLGPAGSRRTGSAMCVERDPGRLGRLRAVRLAGRGLQQHARRPLQVKVPAKRLGDRWGGLGRSSDCARLRLKRV
jgi:hypothetical protein